MRNTDNIKKFDDSAIICAGVANCNWSKMKRNCIICSTIEENPENDIRQRLVEGTPVFLVIKELFGLRIDAAERYEKNLPYRICPACTSDLTVAYKLKCQLWSMQDFLASWNIKHETGEVYSDNLQCKNEPIQELEYSIDIKEETIVLSNTKQRHLSDSSSDSAAGSICDSIVPLKNQPYSEQHLLSVPHGENPIQRNFTCHFCSKRFTFKHNLKTHLNAIHTNSRPYECSICDKTFRTAGPAKIHQNLHLESKFHCHVCNKVFRRKECLTKHLILHNGARNFSCNICDKVYKSNDILARHLIVHKKEREFQCKLCDKAFKRKEDLKRHLIRHIQKSSQFKCDICDQTFTTQALLRSHWFLIHTHERPHKCKICHNTLKTLECMPCSIRASSRAFAQKKASL